MELIALTYINVAGRLVAPGEIFTTDDGKAAWLTGKGAARKAAPAPARAEAPTPAETVTDEAEIPAEEVIKPARKTTRKRKGTEA
jgi:hypothetical protein